MIIDCIADLHGKYPEMKGGDLLIVAGDWTARHTFNEFAFEFITWLGKQPYKKKVVIAGNHDTMLDEGVEKAFDGIADYLEDSGLEYEGFKIWGSPWSLWFPEINRRCTAFTGDEALLKEKYSKIPLDVDILITHSPPLGIMDEVDSVTKWGTKRLHVGSESLHHLLYCQKIRPKLHVFGHIHEGYGHIEKMMDMPGVQFINASYVDENYQPSNQPIRIIL